MTNWVVRNEKSIIRAAFLIPILSVAAISISHVVSWYDLANPLSWAIYLSIAVEIAAMSSIAAASVKIKGFSVWIVFLIVTLIQFIGNIYFCYSEIDVTAKSFKDWSELTGPVFEAMGSDLKDLVAQRRWLALLEGGLLPLISLTCLHFFIQYGEIDKINETVVKEPEVEPSDVVEIQPESEEPVIEELIEVVEEAPIESEEVISEPVQPLQEKVEKPNPLNMPHPADTRINHAWKKPELGQMMKKANDK